jgi:DNA-binding response OmpR family regulator
MTPEMAFECLLLSQDPAVFCTMDRILQDFSIRTNVCSNSSRVASLLAEGNTDLIVIDLQSEDSSEIMHQICQSRTGQEPTVLAVSAMDCAMPGVHVVLRKPVTTESGVKSLKAAYSRMLQD